MTKLVSHKTFQTRDADRLASFSRLLPSFILHRSLQVPPIVAMIRTTRSAKTVSTDCLIDSR